MNLLKKHLDSLLVGLVLLFLVVMPLLTIFVKAVVIDDSLDFSYAATALLEEGNLPMIGNSLLLGLLVVITSTAIAMPLAYLFSRTEFATKKHFDLLFLIPFMTPPYIASMGWILFMQKRGLFAQLFPAFPNGVPAFFTLGGLVLVMSLHLFPFMLTLLRNAMANIPSSLEESAAVMGAPFSVRMRKIFLPLLLGNYAIGALLIFVKTLSEYGTPYTLGRRIGFDVFTTSIHRYAAVAPVSFGKAAVLASVLVTICLLLWMVQNAITTRKSYSLVGGKGKRMTLTPLSPLAKASPGATLPFSSCYPLSSPTSPSFPPLSSSCAVSDSRQVISLFLTTLNFSARRRMMPSPPSETASSLALPAPLSAPYWGHSLCLLYENIKRAARSLKRKAFSRKCSPASSLSSASCSFGMTSTPFCRCTTPW